MPLMRHVEARRRFFGLCLLSCALSVHAVDAHRPSPFVAVYTIEAGGIGAGRMTRTLSIAADDDYRFSAIVEAEGLVALLKPTRIVEESAGRWADAHPVTARYSHLKTSGKKRKETVIDFDWQAGRSHATINGAPVEGKLETGEIDKLSYQLALMRDLAAGVGALEYRVAEAGGGKRYRLERRADERVQVGATAYDAVPVVYARDDGRRTVLWCAPALEYLPVRIEYTEKDGKVTTAELASVDVD